MVSSIQIKASTVKVYVLENILVISTAKNKVCYQMPKKALKKVEYFSSLHSLYCLVQGYGKRVNIIPSELPNQPSYTF
jgi:hypothetical protein